MKTAIIDNYDSFTYNLSHLVKELGAEVTVLRNDQFRLEELEAFDKLILSPGPGIPSEAGLLLDVIRTYAGRKPMLGVCLGEQAIGEAFGGRLINLSEVFHGVQTTIFLNEELRMKTAELDEGLARTNEEFRPDANSSFPERSEGILHSSLKSDYLFDGLPAEIPVGRYHSWVVSTEGLPDCLEVTAVSAEGQIMALRHKEYDIHGIQFHPESVLTPDGKKMIENFLESSWI